MLVKAMVWIFEQITIVTEFRFGPKFAMGIILIPAVFALGLAVSKISTAKNSEEYVGMFIYSGGLFAIVAMVWWLNRHYPERRQHDGVE